MRRLCLVIVCVLVNFSAYAQLYQRVFTRFMRQTGVAFQRSLAAQITVRQSLAKSLLLLQEVQGTDLPILVQGSAFVIEENYNGKKQLWGVTASHYRFAKPELTHLATKRRLHTKIYAQGGGGMNDIAIFPIPTSLKDKVVPLKLAAHGPQLGQKLYSIGFFSEEIHHEMNRTVQEVSPHRVLTSLHVPDEDARVGACGSPILNAQNEVVGVHVSSSAKHQTGGLVPVAHIRDLLTAFHQKDSFEQPIYFNGTQIETLGINEYISEIRVYNQHRLLRTVLLLYHNKKVDYEHLEQLIDTTGGTEVFFILQHQPLLPLMQGYTPHSVILSYNLQTGKIYEKQNDSFVPL